MNRRRALAVAVLAAVAALAACEPVDTLPIQRVPALTIAPTRLTAAVGDSLAVVAAIDEAPRARTTARWRSDRPDAVRLDTAVTPGRPAVARAVAPGSAVLVVTVTHERVQVTGSVPVTVAPR